CIWPEVRSKIFTHFGLSEFSKIFDELALRISPREIGVTLVKAGFGQRFHHLWPGEGFGEKNRVRIFFADAGDQILPEGDRFCMRIVHAEDAHSALGPKKHDAPDLGPELAPVLTAKIQRINVFVLLDRKSTRLNSSHRTIS